MMISANQEHFYNICSRRGICEQLINNRLGPLTLLGGGEENNKQVEATTTVAIYLAQCWEARYGQLENGKFKILVEFHFTIFKLISSLILNLFKTHVEKC